METVLVVDDNDEVRTLNTAIPKLARFCALSTGSGSAAICLGEKTGREDRLIVAGCGDAADAKSGSVGG